MNASLASLRTSLLRISPAETSVERRGFRVETPSMRLRLEQIGQTFLYGYHAALDNSTPSVLASRLDNVALEFRGFAYEGAAMGLALLDRLLPWRGGRLQTFLAGPGDDHAYMIHVGVGWMWARMYRRIDRPLAQLDPLLRWLAVDGYGFHQGYFHWQRYIQAQTIPARLSGYALRAFDQGIGRSLWFVEGAHLERIPALIAGFAPERRGDLWSGVGLAATYAGGVDREGLAALRSAAGAYRPNLAQGAAFAAKARLRAHNSTPQTTIACEALCGLSVAAAAAVTDQALADLPADGVTPQYEIWRRRIQAHFTEEA